jgi:hypothetical protein
MKILINPLLWHIYPYKKRFIIQKINFIEYGFLCFKLIKEIKLNLKCGCKKATFTREADASFNCLCGKCGRPI